MKMYKYITIVLFLLTGCGRNFTLSGGDGWSYRDDMECHWSTATDQRLIPDQSDKNSFGISASFDVNSHFSIIYGFVVTRTAITEVTHTFLDHKKIPNGTDIQLALCGRECVTAPFNSFSYASNDTDAVIAWWTDHVSDYTHLFVSVILGSHRPDGSDYLYDQNGFSLPIRLDSKNPYGSGRWKFENYHPCADEACTNFSVDMADASDLPQKITTIHLTNKNCKLQITGIGGGPFGPS